MDPEQVEAVAEFATRWGSIAKGRAYLQRGAFSSRVVDPQSRDFARVAVKHGHAALSWSHTAQRQHRVIGLSAPAHVTFTTVATKESWETNLDRALAVLRRWGAQVEYGFTRLALPDTRGFEALDSPVGGQPRETRHFGFTNYVERTRHYVLDAYGAQVLSAKHMLRAKDLSRWNVQELTADRYLVLAPDLESWFHPAAPLPSTIDAARSDFGELIYQDTLSSQRR